MTTTPDCVIPMCTHCFANDHAKCNGALRNAFTPDNQPILCSCRKLGHPTKPKNR
jgi:hypothetical protein